MKIFVILFFVLMGNALMAQQTFLVYRLNGAVNQKTGKQFKPIKIGQLLNSSHTISINKGASLVLICEGYNSFTISKSGSHLLSRYLDSCRNEEQSVSAAYFKYVWDEMTHPHTTPESNRRKYMQNTGAVVRGCPGITIAPLFDTVYNSSGSIKLKWTAEVPAGQLAFALFDAEKDGRLLHSAPVTRNDVQLDTIKKYAGGNEEVYWDLTINGNEMCSRKLVKFFKVADYAVIQAELKSSLSMIVNRAERNYAMGFLLETNHFLAEAKIYYKKAAALDPAKSNYREPLNDF